MVNVRKNVTLSSILMLVALLSGCSSSPVREPAPATGAMQQIAADFTGVMIQLESLQPSDTPLLWSEIIQFSGPFSSVLKAGLSEAGYDILPSDDRDDERAVGYFRVEDAYSDDGISGTYIVSVGDIQFRRSYRFLVDGSLVATSDMMARGADMSGVRLDLSALPTVMTTEVVAGEEADNVSVANDSRSLHAGVQNLAGESAGSEPFLSLTNVHEEILRFGRESTVLSRQSRALLQIVANRFDPESDVVVVVGCSQGESQQENGNAELAVARMQAASRKLQDYDVPERNIFEAGCWTDEVMDHKFPQSGVVVILKREVN